MTLASTRELVDAAMLRGGAVPGFNVITLEHAEAIVQGASDAAVGVILQVSENAIRFHGGFRPILAACREVAASARVPVSIHLDHIQDLGLAYDLIAEGSAFDLGSIMIDASTLPYEANLAVTAKFASDARAAGLWVESELGEVGGKDGAHASGVRTDPSDAREFVLRTGVDALAVAVGSSHAMSTRTAQLDHDLIVRLASSVDVPLVLHGSSGVDDDSLTAAVRAGIRKVNVGTVLNIAYTGEIRDHLATAEISDPRLYLTAARHRVAQTVAHLCGVVAQGR